MDDVDRFVIQAAKGGKKKLSVSLVRWLTTMRCPTLRCFFFLYVCVCRCCFNVFLILFYTLVRERLFCASALLLHKLFFFWCFEVSSLNMKATQRSRSYSTSYRRMRTGEILYICMHMCSFFFFLSLAFPDFFSLFFFFCLFHEKTLVCFREVA